MIPLYAIIVLLKEDKLGRKAFKEKFKKTWQDIKEKSKKEWNRFEDDIKYAWRDGESRAKKCLEIINNKGVQICDQTTKKTLVEITDQHISRSHPNLDDCLKQFEKKGYIKCDTTSIAELCLERLQNANKLCYKTKSSPVIAQNISSIGFNFNKDDIDFSLKCTKAITGFSTEIVPCDTLGDL